MSRVHVTVEAGDRSPWQVVALIEERALLRVIDWRHEGWEEPPSDPQEQEDLRRFVGRSFVLKDTKYGALDGFVAHIDRVREGGGPHEDALVAHTSGSDFPYALVGPFNLGEEVSQ